MYVKQLLFVLDALSKMLTQQNEETTFMQTINDFLFKSKLENMNLFKILRYIEKSEICKKLMGFLEKYQNDENEAKVQQPVNQTSGTSRLLTNMTNLTKKGGKYVLSAMNEAQVSTCCQPQQPTMHQQTVMSSPLMKIQGFIG